MLTIRMVKGFGKALGEYLQQADYYAQGMKVEGHCEGQLCAAVGLAKGAAITDEAFERVAANRHAARLPASPPPAMSTSAMSSG